MKGTVNVQHNSILTQVSIALTLTEVYAKRV
jgi:hypothetical protein